MVDDEPVETTDNVSKHRAVCAELTKIYAAKNHDYGDAFVKTFEEEGWAMPRIRLSDKLYRFKTLTRAVTSGDGQKVTDESIRDTLLDLANYAIMSIMLINNDKPND